MSDIIFKIEDPLSWNYLSWWGCSRYINSGCLCFNHLFPLDYTLCLDWDKRLLVSWNLL